MNKETADAIGWWVFQAIIAIGVVVSIAVDSVEGFAICLLVLAFRAMWID